jgi:hypothetical protein
MNDMTRWTVSVSKNTDIAVRSFLAQRGMKKGDLSRFIEEAVKWRVLDQTITEARSKFEDMAPDALEALIGEAVAAARQPAG